VAELRDAPGLAEVSAVWPFEPWSEAQVVHVEIWPGVVEPAAHSVRDAGQVKALVSHWATLDARGGLAPLFDVPESSRAEEGWIFGVPAK
jgi:molybdopterin molybdotransferase